MCKTTVIRKDGDGVETKENLFFFFGLIDFYALTTSQKWSVYAHGGRNTGSRQQELPQELEQGDSSLSIGGNGIHRRGPSKGHFQSAMTKYNLHSPSIGMA